MSCIPVTASGVAIAQFPENHRFQVPECCHWKDVRAKSANIGHALQKAMRCIEQANPDTLHGIFGDAQWTNKDRLPDRMLRELIEHFSSQTLSLSNCPEDELGMGYEFLIKKFADYAFWQHIIKSMKARSGRCAILFPHGVLFRNEESAMREKLVAHDIVELLRAAYTEQCEIVATLFSAWHDFLDQGTTPSDDQIVQEVLNNWHESKKRIPAKRWHRALAWMRKKRLTPTDALGQGAVR